MVLLAGSLMFGKYRYIYLRMQIPGASKSVLFSVTFINH